MDNVEKVISEIENDDEIMRVRFTGLLDDTANELEKHGFGVTRAFLLEKQSHRGLQVQARALAKLLDKLEQYPDIKGDRKTARLVVKAVVQIQINKAKRGKGG